MEQWVDACCMLHAGSYGEEVDLLAPNTLVVAVAVVETERYRLRVAESHWRVSDTESAAALREL